MSRSKHNKKTKTNENGSPTARLHLRYRVREGSLILTLALSVFLFIALVSYHRADPGWSYAAHIQHVANAGGRAGAWISDFFLYLFGYLAYIFPLMLSYAAWLFYRHRHEEHRDEPFKWPLLCMRVAGFILILCAGSSMAAMLDHSPSANLPLNSGGILGTVIATQLLPVFNNVGTSLILVALFLIGITLFTGLSWFQLLERLGSFVMQLAKMAQSIVKKIRWKSFLAIFSNIRGLFEKKEEKLVISKVEPEVSTRVVKNEAPSVGIYQAPKPVIAISERPDLVDEAEMDFKTPRYSKSDVLPKLSLLDTPPHDPNARYSDQQLEERSREVELRLADFGVDTKVVAVHPGPVVTRYELQLAAGTKVSKISNLAKDLARSLSVLSVRVVEVIPGKSVIGLELPNEHREVVYLQEVLGTKQYQNARSCLTLALGKDIAGHPVVVDLAKMPHLLVAGTTGSGKSVSLNAILLSLLYKSTPQQLRFILIDPKMLELSIYDGIPHLLTPVVTNMKDAATALRWCVVEMERRYQLMASLGVRNIAGYNAKIKEARKNGAPLLDPIQQKNNEDADELQELPYIVVLADEFADMMVVVGKKVETLIARLAQKARAAGVHLIFATQRPSVDVITGLIKANISTRIAFQTSSKIDSRTILDQQGAEQLLGYGDMLYLAPGTGVPVRVHGAFVDDDEVHRVVAYLKEHSEPDYVDGVLESDFGQDTSGYTDAALGSTPDDGERDLFYDQAVEMVVRSRRVSISSIQRRFKIGYNRAARIVEAMEAAGVVSPMENNGTREVLAPAPVGGGD